MHGTTMLRRSDTTNLKNVLRDAGGIEKMLEDGYLQFPYDVRVLDENLPLIMEGMRRMIDGSDREFFPKDILGKDEVGWDQDSGLYRRNEREQKWFFHLFKETWKRYQALGAPVERYTDFFMALETLNSHAMKIAIALAELMDEFDKANGKKYAGSLAESFRLGHVVTRILRYLLQMLGKPDAHSHIDRSGFSVHWGATRPALFMYRPDGTRVRVKETENDTLCAFIGKKFAGATDFQYGLGTPHGVVDAQRTSSSDDRFAFVSFVHPQLTFEQAEQIRRHEGAFEAAEAACAL